MRKQHCLHLLYNHNVFIYVFNSDIGIYPALILCSFQTTPLYSLPSVCIHFNWYGFCKILPIIFVFTSPLVHPKVKYLKILQALCFPVLPFLQIPCKNIVCKTFTKPHANGIDCAVTLKELLGFDKFVHFYEKINPVASIF